MIRCHSHSLLAVAFIIGPGLAVAQAPKTDNHGDPLPEGAISRLGTIRWRAESTIVQAHVVDARSAVTVTEDLLVQVWDLASGKEVRRFDVGGSGNNSLPAIPIRLARSSGMRSVVISHDGKRIANLGKDRSAHVWDVGSGKEVNHFGGGGFITDIGLSGDGGAVLTMSLDNGLQVWKSSGNGAVQIGEGKRAFAAEIVRSSNYLSPDGKSLLQVGADRATGTRQPNIVVWDTATGKEKRRIKELPLPQNRFFMPQSLLVSPDLKVAAIPLSGNVIFAELTDGKQIGQIDAPYDPRRIYVFAPDGKSLIGVSGPHEQITVWEVPGGKVLRQFGKPAERANQFLVLAVPREDLAAVSPDGKTLLWCAGSAMSLIDLETGKLINDAAGHTGALKEAFFSAGGAEVLTRGTDPVVRRWDAKSGKETDRLKAPANVPAFLLSPDARWFAAIDGAGGVKLFDAISLGQRRTFTADRRNLHVGVEFSPDSRRLAITSAVARTVEVFETSTGERRARIQLAGAPADDDSLAAIQSATRLRLRTSFSPDGTHLLVASERLLTLWDLARERQVGQIPLGEETLQHAALSPDGRTVALDTSAETSIWELATLLKRVSLHRHPSTVSADRVGSLPFLLDDSPTPNTLAYSPDGRLLAWVGQDRKIRLFHTWTGKQAGLFEGHRGVVMSAAFSPDGHKLVTASADTTALVWDLSPVLAQLKPSAAPLDEAGAEAAWSALNEQDAARAHTAIRTLAGDPAKAVAFLRDLIEPAAGPDPKLLEKLIADLSSPRFAVREKASRELDRLGEGASAALRQAAESASSAEVRKSARKALDNITVQAPTRDQLRVIRSVEVLERAGTPEAIELLKKLAGGAPEVIPTPQARAALERLNGKK